VRTAILATIEGVAVDVPSLYVLGLQIQHRMTSALIGGLGSDAAYVVDHMVREV